MFQTMYTYGARHQSPHCFIYPLGDFFWVWVSLGKERERGFMTEEPSLCHQNWVILDWLTLLYQIRGDKYYN